MGESKSEQKFLDRMTPEPNSGCWLWLGMISATGYGLFSIKGKATFAHRFSYMMYVGEIPPNLFTDHLCRVRCCVNPEHLELVTTRENALRGIGPTAVNAVATHCVNGHEFTPGNTRFSIRNKTGYMRRQCKQCCAANNRRWRKRCRDAVLLSRFQPSPDDSTDAGE